MSAFGIATERPIRGAGSCCSGNESVIRDGCGSAGASFVAVLPIGGASQMMREATVPTLSTARDDGGMSAAGGGGP